MKKITKEELKTILEDHRRWWEEDCDWDGWQHKRGNLCEVDLRGVDLRGVYLPGADLRGADLRGANLCGASLYEADLCGADLGGVCLREADLCRADLRQANLFGAHLGGVNLYEADLRGADLRGTILREANLHEADLYEANLGEEDVIPFIPMACPDEGAFIGYKKAYGVGSIAAYIVKLEILETSKRSSATGRKCRCDKARVLSITNIDGSETVVKKVRSGHDKNFVYEIGKVVSVSNFCTDRFDECAAGIHFFINRQEAVSY